MILCCYLLYATSGVIIPTEISSIVPVGVKGVHYSKDTEKLSDDEFLVERVTPFKSGKISNYR